MADDPWVWTLDELVNRLCHSKTVFLAAGCEDASIPDSAALERQFRSQNITGATFLDALHRPEIRHGFTVHNLDQRLAITSVIGFLQSQSCAYKQKNATGTRTLGDLDNIDMNGRKRQKLTNVGSAALPVIRQDPQHAVPGTGDWDHLLQWEQVDNGDETIEDLEEEDDTGDEDDEDAEAPLEDAHRRGLNDRHDEAHDRSKISHDQIVEIINERIENYTASWRPDKEKDTTYDPVAMWEKANAAGQLQEFVKKYENDMAYYEQRLNTLCDEILKFPGNNVVTVRLQCRNLEGTVESLELATWLRDIYQLHPVDDSEEELSPDSSSSPSIHRDATGSMSQPTLLTHRPQPQLSGEIIDLGSPSESSDNDQDDDVPVDTSTDPGVDVDRHQSTSPRRFYTPDSVIVDTVEPSTHVRSEILTHTQPRPPLIVDAAVSFPPQEFIGDEPEHSSIGTVRGWKWTDLINTQDRKRIVSKAVLELNSENREMIRTRLKFVGKVSLTKEINACIAMMAKKETRMQGVLPRDLPKILVFTRLFLSWWLSQRFSTAEPSNSDLEELSQCLERGRAPDLSVFCDYLAIIMATTFSLEALKHPERPSQREVINLISDDEDDTHRPKKASVLRANSPIVLD